MTRSGLTCGNCEAGAGRWQPRFVEWHELRVRPFSLLRALCVLWLLVRLFSQSGNVGMASSPWLEMFTGWFINVLFVTCKRLFCPVTNERVGNVSGWGSQAGAPASAQGIKHFPLFSMWKAWKRRLLLWRLHNLSKRFMFPAPQNGCWFICQWVLIGWVKICFSGPRTVELGAMSTWPLSPEPAYQKLSTGRPWPFGCPAALPEHWRCLERQVVPSRTVQ